MVSAPGPERDQFQLDLSAVVQAAADSITRKSRKANASYFGKWRVFCQKFKQEPHLPGVAGRENKLCWMLVFAYRYRSINSVRAGSVQKALAAVGQGLADLGVPDPRKPYTDSPKLDPLLTAYLKKLRDEDDPSTRSYPANLPIIRQIREVLDFEHEVEGEINRHILDLIIVAFYWLLRPAEYLNNTGEGRSQAFRFRDITLTVDGKTLPAHETPLNEEIVNRVSDATLTFSDQKNAVRGETVGHTANSDPFFCPAKTLARIALRLQRAHATPDTPISAHYNAHPTKKKWYHVKVKFVTTALRIAAESLQDSTGIDSTLLSARSLRPGGATALLCAGEDTDHIQLLGRWTSDAVFRYLRIQANLRGLSQKMLDHGSYTFAPGAHAAGRLPNQIPASMKQILAHTELADD